MKINTDLVLDVLSTLNRKPAVLLSKLAEIHEQDDDFFHTMLELYKNGIIAPYRFNDEFAIKRTIRNEWDVIDQEITLTNAGVSLVQETEAIRTAVRESTIQVPNRFFLYYCELYDWMKTISS